MSFSFKGYGDSSGSPTSEQAVVSDALAVYRWIVQHCRTENAGEGAPAAEPIPEATSPAHVAHIVRMEEGAASEAIGAPVIVWGHSLGTGYVTMCMPREHLLLLLICSYIMHKCTDIIRNAIYLYISLISNLHMYESAYQI